MKELAIGIDVGGTNSVYGLVDREGHCIAEDRIDTYIYDKAENFVKDVSDKLKIMISESGKISTAGIGIGAPNGNYFRGTVEFAPNLKWKGIIHFADMFRKELGYPAVLTNDANAAAIGEMIYGAARGMKDFIVVTLGTGLGSGFVSNGELIYGHDGFAGELGHTIAIEGGRKCGCGRQGCLEQYASATGIVKTVIEMLDGGKKSSLDKIPRSEITSKKIHEAAAAGDETAADAFDYTARILGKSLADAVAITSPEAIILFGGLAQAGDFIFKPVKRYMEEYMLNVFRNKVKILPSQITGRNAAVLGASALVWKDIAK